MSYRLDVLVNFGQIFALFLGTFTVDFEYYLFIVNATLGPKRGYIYGSRCKTLVSNNTNYSTYGVFFRDLSLEVVMTTSLLIFIILYCEKFH